MTTQEFIEAAQLEWARPWGPFAGMAAKAVAESMGPRREHASLVSSLAACLAQQPQPRIFQSELISPETAARSIDIAEWARPWAEAIRQALFKMKAPPFATLPDAIAWIERESDKFSCQAKAQAALLLAWQRRVRKAADGLARYGHIPDITISRLMMSCPQGGVIVAVPANSPKLQRLATDTAALAKATGWGEVLAMQYLLVGDIEPVVPRLTLQVSVKSDKNPLEEWRSRRVADLGITTGDLSFAELRRVFKALRQHGVTTKKPVTRRAVEVWRFVREHREQWTWRQLLDQWNASHKMGERYRSIRGLRKAWERVTTVLEGTEGSSNPR